MKKLLILIVAFGFMVSFIAPAFADVSKSVDKFKNGAIDVIKSPLELIDHTKAEVKKSDFKAVGLVKGLIMAPFYVVKKAGKGALDMVTCPITD